MNGVTLTWDENSPPDTEVVGLGDDRMRSIKTTTRTGLDDEHNWPSAGGAGVGAHRYGSARPYYGTQSRVSSDGTDGRLMLTSDTSRFFGLTSAGTVFIGGQNVISAFTAPSTLPQRHQWVQSHGTGITSASGNTVLTFPNSGFSGVPFIEVTPDSNGTTAAFLFLHSKSAASCQVMGLVDASGTSATLLTLGIVPFQWRSLGTVAL